MFPHAQIPVYKPYYIPASHYAASLNEYEMALEKEKQPWQNTYNQRSMRL